LFVCSFFHFAQLPEIDGIVGQQAKANEENDVEGDFFQTDYFLP
jgi:hypothetical protein